MLMQPAVRKEECSLQLEQLPIEIREVTLIVLGITVLVAALAGISYGVIANHVTAKKT
jgi:hypothetical protein